MKRKPDHGSALVNPIHAVSSMRFDEKSIARAQLDHLVGILEEEPSSSRQNHHPFGPRLVVPLVRGGRLTPRDDAFETKGVCFNKRLENFSIGIGWKVVQQVHMECGTGSRRQSRTAAL